jgi:hypothetical protein
LDELDVLFLPVAAAFLPRPPAGRGEGRERRKEREQMGDTVE